MDWECSPHSQSHHLQLIRVFRLWNLSCSTTYILNWTLNLNFSNSAGFSSHLTCSSYKPQKFRIRGHIETISCRGPGREVAGPRSHSWWWQDRAGTQLISISVQSLHSPKLYGWLVLEFWIKLRKQSPYHMCRETSLHASDIFL